LLSRPCDYKVGSDDTETSDPSALLRLNSSNSRADGDGSAFVEQALSYSIEDEDRQSEDSGGMDRRRQRTHSEISSDDGSERDGPHAASADAVGVKDVKAVVSLACSKFKRLH
jgi:hypothetical protein